MNRLTITVLSALFIAFTFNSFVYPQHNRKNDERRMPIVFDRTEFLLNKIKEKLDKLDVDYLSRLHKKEYSEAKKELHKIYDLIEAIKEEQVKEEESTVAAMPDSDYKRLVENINKESFEENKIAVLQASVKYNYLSIDQIIGLMDLSTFSSWKLKALELSYPFAVDKNNSYKIINGLNFSEDKKKAQEILNKY